MAIHIFDDENNVFPPNTWTVAECIDNDGWECWDCPEMCTEFYSTEPITLSDLDSIFGVDNTVPCIADQNSDGINFKDNLTITTTYSIYGEGSPFFLVMMKVRSGKLQHGRTSGINGRVS